MDTSQWPELLAQSFQTDEPLVPPDAAMLNVIRRCNAGCGYCADWKNDPDPRTDPKQESIKRILRGFVNLGVQKVIFAGGEPLLRRDLEDLMEYASSIGLETAVITNGTAVTRARAGRICDLRPSFVGISLDSLNAARMYEVRRLPLSRVLSAIDYFTQIRDASYPELQITLQVTITRVNIGDLIAIAEFAGDRGLNVTYQPVAYAGSGSEENVLTRLWPDEREVEQLAAVVDQLVELRSHSKVRIRNREDFLRKIPLYFRNKTYYPGDACTAAYTDIVVDTEYGVRPCWPMEPVAHLDDHTTIEDVWFSEAMRQARREIRAKRCPGCLYAGHLNKPHLNLD